MGITSISLQKPVATTTDITSLVQTGKGSLKDDPQSGSILKILAENGFQDKIQEGSKKGHTYNILHAAPSSDFTLIDSWVEDTVDEEGQPKSRTRKAYQFFQIKSEVASAPVSVPKPPVPTPSPEQETTSQKVEVSQAPTPKEMLPEVFATEIPKTTTTVPTPALELPIKESVSDVQVVTDKEVTNPTDQTSTETKTEESGTWLRSKLGIPVSSSASTRVVSTPPFSVGKTEKPTSLPVGNSIPSKKGVLGTPIAGNAKNSETYELLKKRFGNAKNPVAKSSVTPFVASATPTPSGVPMPPGLEATKKSNEETAQEKRKLAFLEKALGGTLDGALLQEWSKAKTIPAKPFVYPTEYAWGMDGTGKPIGRSLENYPVASQKLRGQLVAFIDQLGTRNIDTEKINVGQAIDLALQNNLI